MTDTDLRFDAERRS